MTQPAEALAWEAPSLPESRVDWIRVEGLPADTDAGMVARSFQRYGKVVEAFVDPDGSKPFIFVRLAGDSGASTEKARAEDAALCVDSAIRNLNQSEMGAAGTIVTVVKAPALHQIFVGNISVETTSDEIRELFAKFGTVARVTVVENEGVALGYAFVGKSIECNFSGVHSRIRGPEKPVNAMQNSPRRARPKKQQSP
jgi:hypothetical protein